jgi:hypothetical protein
MNFVALKNHSLGIQLMYTINLFITLSRIFHKDQAVVQNIINNSPQIIPTHYSAFIYRMLE